MAYAKPQHSPRPIDVLDLELEEIFPLCTWPSSESDSRVVNEAYKSLFRKVIPNFETDVHFVLAEVLELDRAESRPRILVYSDQDESGVKDFVAQYFKVIDTLSDDDWSISKTDTFYTGSRIWCAETISADCQVQDNPRDWIVQPGELLPRGYQFGEEVDEEKEMGEIKAAFDKYVETLYELHLKNYPFAYVMLIPIFLGSMYGEKQARKKLGAVFLHFATKTRITDHHDLRRIYGRTLLFWHYYFTSEAVDKRDRATRASETKLAVYHKIQPYIDELRSKLKEVQKPLSDLEAELSPEVVLFGKDLSMFFQAGPTIRILDGKQEIIPKHGWLDGSVDLYKRLVAAVLIQAFQLENDIESSGAALWEEMSRVVINRANEPTEIRCKELLKIIPQLRNSDPTERQVKETFKIVKSWYSDAFKLEGASAIPITMLEFAFRVWGGDFQRAELASNFFWVASERPIQTIAALGILHDKQQLRGASINIQKGRTIGGKTKTSCALKIELAKTHRQTRSRSKSSLAALRDSLADCCQNGKQPGGDTTKFLWILAGKRELSLSGTVFSWKSGNDEFAVDFVTCDGVAKEMLINWTGEINL